MSDDFSREILKRSVARACVALDYKSAHSSVLESLADIMEHYVKTLGEVAHDNAELAGRANPGIHDFISALESQV
jgi:histone H3/H4